MPRPDPNPTLRATDRCVMCGMCLPHCPTYGKTRNEADSPRGRISLIQGLVNGRLELDAKLLGHLDGCLTCRACEAVCPSGVPYGEIIDAAREALYPQRPHGLHEKAGQVFIDSRPARRAATAAIRFYQASGLQSLARASGLLRATGLERREHYLPKIDTHRPAPSGTGPRVALFTGCASEVFDRETLAATARLLAALGYRVEIPAAQGCCGAIDQHAGRTARAQRLIDANLGAFAGYEAVISTASGCGAMLAEYGKHRDASSAHDLGRRVVDVNRFLAEALETRELALRPLNARVAAHAPCSLTHVLKGAAWPLKLLAKIPQLAVSQLPDNNRCCGAAGSYMLTQPAMADSLRDDKLARLKALNPDYLVTSNIGCALHLRAGIEAEGLDIEVLHPVTLLARQLVDDAQ